MVRDTRIGFLALAENSDHHIIAPLASSLSAAPGEGSIFTNVPPGGTPEAAPPPYASIAVFK